MSISDGTIVLDLPPPSFMYARPVRVVCIAGARPNFVKIKPVVDALELRSVDVVLVHTGQHYDQSMSRIFFDELGIRAPDHHLDVGSGTHARQTAAVMIGLEPILARVRPDVLVVVGDVNSTMAAALVGAKATVAVAHVEAGLRSGDWSMPEEVNRVVTDCVSQYLFAPSADAVDNLRREGCDDARIHLVGNVMIDTLLANLDRARARPVLADLGLEAGQYGVVTLHRPSNVDKSSRLKTLVGALGEIAAVCPLVLPVHPRTDRVLTDLEIPPGLRLIPALGYLDFVALEAGARLVLTDSGGVQEETTVLGIPCLTLRDSTERPLTVTEGTNTVVGHEPLRIVAEARRALGHDVEPRRPALWDGRAAERIAAALVV
jgi:UDP-N-acetylglucosamine 2-epimerase (non-hydrolysing)